MSLDNNKILARGRSLANLVKQEIGNKVILRSKILQLCKTDEFAKVILSSAQTFVDKIKIIYSAYFHINGWKPEQISEAINNLYFVKIDFFDSDVYPNEQCDRCDGEGMVDCWKCDGDGTLDCDSCDGDGTIECDGCGGDGTEECRYCDGKGTETEEDDEGNEIEVECVHCDGSGEQKCRDCGGAGNFECPTCDGTGNQECHICENTGREYCDYCGGSGEVESDDMVYQVTTRHYVTVGNKILRYNDKILSLDDFERLDGNDEILDYELSIYYTEYNDNISKEDRNEKVGMEDDYFVEIFDAQKLESTQERNYGI